LKFWSRPNVAFGGAMATGRKNLQLPGSKGSEWMYTDLFSEPKMEIPVQIWR
jgi:hypothetical protein